MSDEDVAAPAGRDLSAVDQRIIGSLIEKALATPQNYPLTLNALRLACNQTSNRDPVVDYDEHTIDTALASLRERGLTRIMYSTSNRAAKYRHVLDETLHLDAAGLAVLAVLLLRGPQTVGEIKGRTERLHPFADLGAAESMLDALAQHRDGPLVERLDRQPGQKDARYRHRLGAVDELPTTTAASTLTTVRPTASHSTSPAPGELDELRAEVAELRATVATLRADLDDLRSAFE